MVPRFLLKLNRSWTITSQLSNSCFDLNGNIKKCFWLGFLFASFPHGSGIVKNQRQIDDHQNRSGNKYAGVIK